MITDPMKREIERAIHDAEHPVGMSIHDGVARIRADTLRRLVAQRDEALAQCAEWETKAATWMASPQAVQRLEGYRELAQRLERAEAQRDALLNLIGRIRKWDHLSSAADGPFWQREIDAAIAKAEEA